MRERSKGFIAGILVSAVLAGTIGTAAATIGSRTVKADYNNIKVSLDGQQIALKDANGKTVEPFAIDGTTYLPVRAVADALGLGVSWDANSNTVILSSDGSQGENQDSNQVDLSTASGVRNCLKENYSKLNTSIGEITFDISVSQNDSEYYPYDYKIYLTLSEDEFNKFSSISYTEQQISEAKVQLKNMMKQLADSLISISPSKKYLCSYRYYYYDYPTIKTGFHEYKMFTWTNFDVKGYSMLQDYRDTPASTFRWYDNHDLLSWRI